ncbi:hypothetical protein PHLGIDRAFT_98272 [Phlebiopsis gigantea 11061_1 CR5-6]|uniref:CAP-Gly domain-containing protein n=1 Tax=Phlebiopsis gigantea (strain 11061_1 CR5-6) TaxID=745531 RepID=A0A0C3SFM0_PHLG1|nr:hypothetical protein PHLGIDRAFT_98272 [Phlebiopsis gigantea 11061_1 CR5-6]
MMQQTTSSSATPAVGTRFALAGHLGTVRFVGPVEGTRGLWLGVEWDDPARGKHDGVKDNRRYFSCLVPNTGSFIRPTANGIDYGTSFLQALVSKYIELPHGTSVEKVILGSSNGAIEVEAPGLDKVRGKLSNLQRLKIVSLDNHGVATPDPPGEIERVCSGIRGLDLSKSLLSSWDAIAQIVSELPALGNLVLNQNRLSLPSNIPTFRAAFSRIRELQINSTLTTWTDLRRLVGCMPSLTRVESGYNRLHSLSDGPDTTANNAAVSLTLQEINLDGNFLQKWSAVYSALTDFTNLERLVLSDNAIDTIDERTKDSPSLQHLKHLSLMSNGLKVWRDVDRLVAWCPALASLTLAGNPLVEDEGLRSHARQFTIAKIPSLTVFDGAAITAKERIDCELFYLSYITKHGPYDEVSRQEHHPRYKELCTKHAIQDTPHVAPQEKQDTLSNRLFGIIAHRCARPPSTPGAGDMGAHNLRVLPSMTMRTFRMKLAKTFKLTKAEQASVRMWIRMPEGTYTEVDLTDDNHELDWWGLEDGSEIAVVTT